jgi:hypothetical protein
LKWHLNRRTTADHCSATSDSHPEFRGDGIVNGAAVWINAWVKESRKTGKKFFSLSFRPKRERIDRSRPLSEDLDDSIPF